MIFTSCTEPSASCTSRLESSGQRGWFSPRPLNSIQFCTSSMSLSHCDRFCARGGKAEGGGSFPGDGPEAEDGEAT